MKIFLRSFLAIGCLILIVSCSSDEEIGKEEVPLKFIRTIDNKSGYTEKWIYNDKNNVVKIVSSNDKTSTFEYDNNGELVKADTYFTSEPNLKSEEFRLEYLPGKIIVNVKKYFSGKNITERKEHILDNKGRPTKSIESDGFKKIYTLSNGNVSSVFYANKNDVGSVIGEYLYDDKRNLYSNYPIGFRLIRGDEFINENNVIWSKNYNYQESINNEYDKDGYLTKDHRYYYTY
ncbi:hypothetical protein [Chryseobacterium pennipullorum]|uniref:YD repeat-containing protein n=1 Tax=Chryseobacterium pennipullorum TaxID=2258963 RepID=A0A3D9B7C5_9FLAO|nr:hypothetical protein [Chryseobacterium pennipullorum]REC49166.1 hypothetical protein DRF67_06340 [Chryseobacterium pennipullorum]